ncbi:reverse transcriptase domain-containing protein [Tanacetum coccineum]
MCSSPERSKTQEHGSYSGWIVCVDGSGAGLILTNPEGMEFTYALRFEFTATNNEAEYEALIAGLRIAARMGVRILEANCGLPFGSQHVLVLVKILKNKSTRILEISTVIEEQDPTWMTPLIEFISKGTLPHEQKDAWRIRRTTQRFKLRNGVLYRTFISYTMARCVGSLFRQKYVLREFMRVPAVLHSGPRSVVVGLTVLGTTGPTMHRGRSRHDKKLQCCQVHRPIRAIHNRSLTPLPVLAFHKLAVSEIARWVEAIVKCLRGTLHNTSKLARGHSLLSCLWDGSRYTSRNRNANYSYRGGDFVIVINDDKPGGKTRESWDQLGRTLLKVTEALEKEHTCCVTWMGVSLPARRISAISRNAYL